MRRIGDTAFLEYGAKIALRAALCMVLTCVSAADAAQATTPTSTPSTLSAGATHPPVSFIVPSAEGGSADRIGRIVAKALARVLEVPVQVTNIPGVGGVTGTNILAKAPKDGSTLGLGLSWPMVGGKLLSRAAEYNPIDDFDWLAILGTFGNAMVVRQDHSARSLLEWLDYARASPKPLRYGTAGTASAGHLAGEFLHLEQRANLVHVPIGTPSQAYAALASGEIEVLLDGAPAARIAANSKQFRILAVTSAKRDPLMPDVPAFGEIWRGQQFTLWAAIIAPNHLSPELRSRLAAAIGVMLADKGLVAELQGAGVTWLGLAGSDASQFVKDDLVHKARQIGEFFIQPTEALPRSRTELP